MSVRETSESWINLLACPIMFNMTIPTGRDRNNYIVIGRKFASDPIISIYKYDINVNKWNKICGLNNIQNRSLSSATLDAKKQILYLVHKKGSVSEIQLNNGNINTNTHSTTISSTLNPSLRSHLRTSASIILNHSLFIVGSMFNNSILKWNLENKTLTNFCDMYNKMRFSTFGLINKNNCLLLFGGYDYD
eukprot:246354_1